MILEYHRPKQLDQALELLSRQNPPTIPLGGGTTLAQRSDANFAVVDLQDLGLDGIRQEGATLVIGATASLAKLLDEEATPEAVKSAIRLEGSLNVRNVATLAGILVAGSGESILLGLLLAADARMVWLPGERTVSLGEYLAMRQVQAPGKLIREIQLPLQSTLRFEKIARTPMDQVLVGVSIARWPSGRTRVVLSGSTAGPVLAMDGTEAGGAAAAAINACSQLSNQRSSINYLKETTRILVQRILGE